jgi:hypothetical protein
MGIALSVTGGPKRAEPGWHDRCFSIGRSRMKSNGSEKKRTPGSVDGRRSKATGSK